jgi:hypothetical protein
MASSHCAPVLVLLLLVMKLQLPPVRSSPSSAVVENTGGRSISTMARGAGVIYSPMAQDGRDVVMLAQACGNKAPDGCGAHGKCSGVLLKSCTCDLHWSGTDCRQYDPCSKPASIECGKNGQCIQRSIVGCTGPPENCTVAICKCTAKWTGPQCSKAPCHPMQLPKNAKSWGNCPGFLQPMKSGLSCQPECYSDKVQGYYNLTSNMTCSSGTITKAVCSPRPCDATKPGSLAHDGKQGNCTSKLNSGQICKPNCDDGFFLIGNRSCSAGRLTDTAKAPLAGCWPKSVIISGTVADNGVYTAKGQCNGRPRYKRRLTPVQYVFWNKDAKQNSWVVGKESAGRNCKPLLPGLSYGDLSSRDCPGAPTSRSCAPWSLPPGPNDPVNWKPCPTCFVRNTSCFLEALHPNFAKGSCNLGDYLATGNTCYPRCTHGYQMVGKGNLTCANGDIKDTTKCVPSPCTGPAVERDPPNGTKGTCSEILENGHSCMPVCRDGYQGSGCRACALGNLNDTFTCRECDSTMCGGAQRGVCSDNGNSCKCKDDWNGVGCMCKGGNCDLCATFPCTRSDANATCVNDATERGYTCNCSAGFNGANCEPRSHEPNSFWQSVWLKRTMWERICILCTAMSVLPVFFIARVYKATVRSLPDPDPPLTPDQDSQGSWGLFMFLVGIADLCFDITQCVSLRNSDQDPLFICCLVTLLNTTALTWYLAHFTLRECNVNSCEARQWSRAHPIVATIVGIASASRLSSVAIVRLRLCGGTFCGLDFPDSKTHKYFEFVKNAGIYHIWVEDIPHILISIAALKQSGLSAYQLEVATTTFPISYGLVSSLNLTFSVLSIAVSLISKRVQLSAIGNASGSASKRYSSIVPGLHIPSFLQHLTPEQENEMKEILISGGSQVNVEVEPEPELGGSE